MATRPTVLHIVDKFGVRGSSIHGVSRLFAWWFPRFDTGRFTVRLVGLRKQDVACEQVQAQGIDVLSLGKGKFDCSTLPAIVRLIRREQAALLHLHGYGASNFGRAAARLTGVRTIVHEHFVDPAMPPYQIPFDYGLSRWMDRGIAVSQSVKDFMVRKRFMPAQRVEVVFNGAPLAQFQPVNGECRSAERHRWHIAEHVTVLASIGRLDEQKGNRYFLEAAARLLRDGAPIVALVVGDGPHMGLLQAQAQALGIAEHVIFTGYQANIPAIQSMVDIQVFASLWEGTPLTLFEAMAMCRPIVSTTVDGLGEVLEDGVTARLVPPRDSGALATAIGELIRDRQQADRLAQRAFQESRRFDIQATVDRIQELYDEVLASRPAGGG